MELKQIATILNTVKIPNALGETVTIADDLSNVDEGIDVSNMDGDTCKDYLKQLAVGVVTTITRVAEYPEETFGLYHDEVEYGGVLQVVKARGRLKAYDCPILTLANYDASSSNPDYTDGHYYGGPGLDSKLFAKDVIDEIRYSIPVEMFKQSFTGPQDVRKLFALIEANAKNTLRSMNKELARSILLKIIASAYGDSREVKLFTLYNTVNGYASTDPGYVSLSNYRKDHKFKLFAQQVFIRLKDQMLDYNKKYNDGTVEVFCNKDELRTIILEDFYTDILFTQSGIFHNELTDVGEVYKVNFWQNASKDLLPCIASGSVHDQVVVDGGESADTTINHVVAIIGSKFMGGITNRVDKARAKYIPEGDFNTIFHGVMKKYFIDSREESIIVTLS